MPSDIKDGLKPNANAPEHRDVGAEPAGESAATGQFARVEDARAGKRDDRQDDVAAVNPVHLPVVATGSGECQRPHLCPSRPRQQNAEQRHCRTTLHERARRRQHEPPDRRKTKAERRRRQKLLRQQHKCRRRALMGTLVEQPPQQHRQMNEVEQPPECGRERRFRCICRADDGLLEDVLDAVPRERRARGKHALLGIADQHRSERAQGDLMWLEDVEARLQRKEETVAPRPGGISAAWRA